MTIKPRLMTRALLVASAIAGFVMALVLVVGPANAGNANSGASIYKTNCAACHGPAGKGNGPAAKALNPKPRDFTDAAIMSKISDATIAKTIKKGGQAVGKSPLMPGFAQLSPAQVDDLVAYTRALCKCKYSGK